MKRFLVLAAALGSAMLTATPAAAQESEPLEIRRFGDVKNLALDRSKAYLLVEAPGQVISRWLALPSDAERADWEEQRQAALAEKQAKFAREMERYQERRARWEASPTGEAAPEMPVEPTDANFAWPALEAQRVFTVGPQNRFANGKEFSLWLFEVPVGKYVFYGVGTGGAGDCACMGTMAFNTRAGMVTAVRVGLTWLDERGNSLPAYPGSSNSTDQATRFGMMLQPPSDYVIDPRIPFEMLTIPDFELVQRMPNYFGERISRIQPFPGLVDYHRDEMLDMRPGR
ncbi:hypothetical protein K3152_07210 [Qipengyuania sp. 1NDH17]|uniref:Uncharacterized protein n=1 Tax=Qipengyuania polymorpha TaxID=2867234 RepID=A0ABS7IWV7_9SPHN|nr:hypothetical protein [Qipengyuania polymorpha]MBX7458032.1 hypothetical protein [Qipengyuania polymorpha]